MKKAELQMQETILVLFIFFIILVMGLVVFYRYNLGSIENYKIELEESEQYLLLSTLPNYLGYSYLGNNENAIDTSKLLNLNLSLGFKKIIVEVVEPEMQEIECSYNNYPDCNRFLIYNKEPIEIKNKIIKSIPVSLYYPLESKYKSGRLIIEDYY